ncbi:Ethanolamine ammonia-lyase light chain [Variovorax sp. YR750]|uniref:ethanolamine ammonia-lyase subunit EutC n=1 Tax=Variovorax sp. YR750 TaxID=1884384 RepID=UPI0008C8867E|nr:Ethanolamine ammonia-lyase light chain [Variovorax sp. YR750]
MDADNGKDGRVDAPTVAESWTALRGLTPARIAIGRAGVAALTAESLQFSWSHAMARDAIHAPLDTVGLEAKLRSHGWDVLHARSRARDRQVYLQRPDLGRQLDLDAARLLGDAAQERGERPDVMVVIGDGLSSLAVQSHVAPLLAALRDELPANLRLGPLVIVEQARVAVADEVGELFAASLIVMLIGERPGLSSPDSLGIYITYGPRRGRSDAERNCISNVRPAGLSYTLASRKLAWLVRQALRLGLTGVVLKDESPADSLPTSTRAVEQS